MSEEKGDEIQAMWIERKKIPLIGKRSVDYKISS